MKEGYLRHIATGLRVIGTYDMIPACARFNRVVMLEDGGMEPDWIGETDVWWDDQVIHEDELGRKYYVVEGPVDGLAVVPARECEFVEDNDNA